MAVPPKTDPRWKRLLTGVAAPDFTSLATKLTVGRLRRDVKQKPVALPVATEEIHTFFVTNDFAQRDVPLI